MRIKGVGASVNIKSDKWKESAEEGDKQSSNHKDFSPLIPFELFNTFTHSSRNKTDGGGAHGDGRRHAGNMGRKRMHV